MTNFRLAFARIVTHYFANAAFLDDRAIVGRLDRIAHIPAVLIVEDDAGHAGGAAMNATLIKATDEFAAT